LPGSCVNIRPLLKPSGSQAHLCSLQSYQAFAASLPRSSSYNGLKKTCVI
jgi:hypothetical protein